MGPKQVLVWVFLALVVSGVGLGSNAGAVNEAEATAPGARHAVPVDRDKTLAEVLSLRTSRSRTFALGDGSYEQVVARTPINFRDGSGRWMPIDSRLERQADGTLENAANSFDIRIPATADGPVVVESGGRQLHFELIGADSRSLSVAGGTQATFVDALPGVDAVYEARATSVKETLHLESPGAARDLRFAVEAPGLRARVARSGAVEFLDADGTRRFGFATPWMQDASGTLSRAVRYELEQGADGPRVLVRVDERWLNDPARRFPVAVDPTVYTDPYGVCQLADGLAANVNDCSDAGPVWVGRESGRRYRAAVAFPAPQLPFGATVLSAHTTFCFDGQSAAEPSTLDLHRITREFDEDVTWNRADLMTSWTTAGGDFDSARETRRQMQPAWVGSTAALGMPRLVQAWADGREDNYGALIKAADESVTHVDVLSDVQMRIRYRPRLGVDGTVYEYDRRELSDGSLVSVNLGNGNFVLTADDFGLDGLDGQLAVDRAYNSMDDVTEQGVFGVGWRGDFGTVSLDRDPVDGSYAFNGASGLDGLFFKRPDGTFVAPEGWQARLTEQPSARSVTVQFDVSGEQWLFAWSSGERYRLVRRAYYSEAGAEATYGAAGGALSRLTDSDGNVATFGWTSGRMTTVTDQFGDVRHYGYDTAGRLTSYRSVAGGVTTYAYDGSGRLTSISLPDRSGMTFTYWPGGELRTLTPIGSDTRTGATTTYTRGSARTTVTTPGAKTEVDQFDNQLFAYQRRIGPAPPSLSVTGGLAHAHRTTIPAGGTGFTYAASDPDGLASVRVVVEGADDEPLWPGCESTCGSDWTGYWEPNVYDYAPGPAAIRVVATDANGDVTEQSILVTIPNVYDGSGVDPGTAPDPDAATPLTTAPCVAYFGSASPACDTTTNEDPLAEEPVAFTAPDSLTAMLAATGSGMRYGVAQDFQTGDWPNHRFVRALAPRDLRRIVPFNIADTVDESRLRPGTSVSDALRKMKHPERFEQFAAVYSLIYRDPGSLGNLIVSFNPAICGEPVRGDTTPDCRGDDAANSIPDREQYKRSLRNFLTMFPKVNTIGAWNEPNHHKSPFRYTRPGGPIRGMTAGGPVGAANVAFWATEVCNRWNRDMRGTPKCTVMTAELAQSGPGDNSTWLRYLKDYVRQVRWLTARRDSSFRPKIWAFHPYVDVRTNTDAERKAVVRSFRSGRYVTGTKQMAAVIPTYDTRIWFTEVGSRVDRLRTTAAEAPLSRRRNTMASQSAEVEFLYSRLPRASGRVRRIVYYQMFGDRITSEEMVGDLWDSALTGNWETEREFEYGGIDGHARPSYCAVLSYMNPSLPDTNPNKPELCHRR